MRELPVMTDFVHLLCHTEYSIVDGLLKFKSFLRLAAKYDMQAVAMTDYANLFGLVKFYKTAVENGVKPIVGCDVLLENEQNQAEPYQLLLLCQNNNGYKNLIELISEGYFQRTHNKPVIKNAWLKEKSKGLIAIAKGVNSDIGKALLTQKLDVAETLIEYWNIIFPDRFYLGISRTNKLYEEDYINAAVKLSKKKSVPLVALNDVCFLTEDDFEAHEARVCINRGQELACTKRPRDYTKEQYLKTTSQMLELFSDLPEACINTVEIAKRCNLFLELGKVFLPNFPVPQGMTAETYLIAQSEEGLAKRLVELNIIESEKQQKYHERLKIELDVINSMGFAGYFLIVADFIAWSFANGVPVGPGRGSGAGSLVAYALKITNLDPLEYDLLFERFLNPERVSMPDFDIDFCMEGRDRVIEYVGTKYGKDAVSQIITYGTMAAKAVVRDVGRVLGQPYGFVDKIAKLIPMELGMTLEKALAQEEALLERYNQEEEVKTLIDLAKKLEGTTRNVGRHAGGVVIAPSKLTDFTPLFLESGETQAVTQFDKNDVEEIGLVKFDFLGLRTLTIIDWALDNINKLKALKNEDLVDITKISLTDDKTFELLQKCHTTAVFQLESRGMKDLIRRLKPDRFEDIVALVALFRPGPLQSGMVDDFINRKLGLAQIEYPHPELGPILKPTYGVILYQEQVMQIAQVLAGYTLGAADLLRRAMGKKKPEEMAKQREIFTKGAVARDIPEELATYIFDLMEKFAGYGFNKSHSAAYALVSYQTAWLKTHYPESFMAAVLSSDMTNTDKVLIFIDDCKELNIKIMLPSVNTSFYKFTVNNSNIILYGLGAIKGVGESAIESIVEARTEGGKFTDLFDFCNRVDLKRVNKRTLEALVLSGAFDSFNTPRYILMHNLEKAVNGAQKLQKDRDIGQFDLFGNSIQDKDSASELLDLNVAKWTKREVLEGEKQTLGFYLTGHPIEEYEAVLSKIVSKISSIRARAKVNQLVAGFIVAIRFMLTKKGDKMAFLTIDDQTGRQEVAVFSKQVFESRDVLKKDELVIIEGEVSVDDYSGGLKMRANRVMSIEEAKAEFAKAINIELDASTLESTNVIKNVRSLLSGYIPGTCPVNMKLLTDKAHAKIQFGDKWMISPCEQLIEDLNKLSESLKASVVY